MNTPTKRRRKSDDNLWQNPTTSRLHWDISLTRKDGSVYRGAGSRKDKTLAIKDRDDALAEFNRSEARAGSWTVKSWGEHVSMQVRPFLA